MKNKYINKCLNRLPYRWLKIVLTIQLFVLRMRKTYTIWKYTRHSQANDLNELVPMRVLGPSEFGARFTPVKSWSPKKALVYLYRYPQEVGFAYRIRVTANGREVVKLCHGAYYPFYVDPGRLEVGAKTRRKRQNSVMLSVKAGRIYYLRATGFVLERSFTVIAEGQAERELPECYMVLERDIARAAGS